MKITYLRIGSILALLAVAFGALGAHWLKANVSQEYLQSFETAVKYQMYHALGIILLSAFDRTLNKRFLNFAFYAFLFGIIFFSGSIYLLSTRELSGLDWKWLGAITPLGGLLFITGWVMLVISSVKEHPNS